MIKIIFLFILLLSFNYPLRADQTLTGDQEFTNELDNTKDPFQDGYPKVVAAVEVPKPVYIPPASKPSLKPLPKLKPVPIVITMPSLDLEGVMVGDGMNEAIIDGKIVPLDGLIHGVRVIAINKNGIRLEYKGKKFFLKID